MSPNPKVVQLRQLLATRFPAARFKPEPVEEKARNVWPTGISGVDESLNGGLLKAAITELVAGRCCGSALFISAILRKAAAEKQIFALADGLDSFDPTSFNQRVLHYLLWVRCKDAAQALKATDLLLRDRNFPLVVLDLAINPVQQLRKIPSSTWYRLQRIVESSGTTFVVVTPQAMVGCAQVRLRLKNRFTLDDLEDEQTRLLGRLKPELTQYRLKISKPSGQAAAAG